MRITTVTKVYISLIYFRLIMFSNCFEELDLEKNLIGDMAAKEVLDALEHRKETGKWAFHYICRITFLLDNNLTHTCIFNSFRNVTFSLMNYCLLFHDSIENSKIILLPVFKYKDRLILIKHILWIADAITTTHWCLAFGKYINKIDLFPFLDCKFKVGFISLFISKESMCTWLCFTKLRCHDKVY